MFGISKTAKQISLLDLVKIIEAVDNKGMVPFSLTQITVFKTRKSDHERFILEGYSGKGGETAFAKVAQVNGNLNISYEKAVNRNRVEEGLAADFKPKPTDTYDRQTKAISTKGEFPDLIYYLTYMPRSVAADFESKVYGLKDGAMYEVNLEDPDIAAILPAERAAGSGRQGTEESEVQIRTISFSSIAAIRLNKEDFIITDIDAHRKAIFDAAFADK